MSEAVPSPDKRLYENSFVALAITIGLPTLLFAMLFGMSELGGEVVSLQRPNSDGSESLVRIWIVDQDDSAWIEHGEHQSYWITKLSESSAVTLIRRGEIFNYRGSIDLDSHLLYHKLRREKYGWADAFIALFTEDADHCNGVPVRLQQSPPHLAGTTQ